MQLFALIAIQALAVILIVGNTPQSPAAKIVRHAVKQVLGISYLAQDTTDQTQPTDQTQTQPTDQTQQPTTQQAQPTAAQTTEQPTPQTTEQPATETPTSPMQQTTESQAPTETIQPTEAQLTETPTPEGQLDSQQMANTLSNNLALPLIGDTVSNADANVSSTENIETDVVTQAERNDKAINAATSPDQKSSDLLTSEQEDLNLLTTTIRNSNYASSSFLTQRLISNLQTFTTTLPTTANRISLQNQFITLCNQADTQLRTQQLTVPEELEQDIEITRSLCK